MKVRRLAAWVALPVAVAVAWVGAVVPALRAGELRAHVADHLLTVASDDPRVIKEMQVTTYHILWELVHVFFEQPGVLDPGVLT